MLPQQDAGQKKFPLRRFIAVIILMAAAGAVYAASTRPSGGKGDILGEQAVLLVSPPPRQGTTPVPATDLRTAVTDLLEGPGRELQKTAVDTASQVRESVVTTIVRTVTSQIDKLAPQDKEKVKESICR